MKISDVKLEFELPHQVKNEQEMKLIETLIKITKVTLLVIFASAFVGRYYMSVLFMLLMGLINGLQIQALSALFAVRMPFNANAMMVMIMKLVSFDIF